MIFLGFILIVDKSPIDIYRNFHHQNQNQKKKIEALTPHSRQALAKVTAEDVASFAAGMALAPARRSCFRRGVGRGKGVENHGKPRENPWKITETPREDHGQTWGNDGKNG